MKKEKLIARALLSVNKNVSVVCKKVGPHKGIYRTQPLKVIAGAQRKTANYRESGCRFKVNLEESFFSVRLATERNRISGLIKKGEVVGAFFAGVGPFPIVFAKNSPMAKAYAIELNPNAYKQMLENIELNKVEGKVVAIKGDVREKAKEIEGKCDRIVMPLPKGGESFLDSVMLALKPKGGVVHFYQFTSKQDPFTHPLRKAKAAAEKAGYSAIVSRKKQVRAFSPSRIQVVLDIKLKPKKPTA